MMTMVEFDKRIADRVFAVYWTVRFGQHPLFCHFGKMFFYGTMLYEFWV